MKYIIPTLLLIVSFITGYYWVYPSWIDTQNLLAERNAYDEAIKQVKAFKERKNILTQRLDGIPDRDKQRMRAIMPQDADPIRLVMNINEYAKRRNIDTWDFAVQGDENGENRNEEEGSAIPYESTRITFSFSGTYNQMVSFIEGLQQQSRIFDITHLSFEADDEDTVYDYQLELYTYSLRG